MEKKLVYFRPFKQYSKFSVNSLNGNNTEKSLSVSQSL